MLTLYLSALMAVFLVVSVSSDSGDNVRLVVSKEILNEFIFEEKEMTVLYTIYNFHESRAARDVELLDTFAETEFTLIHGSPSARWSVIPASSNVTHVLILKPQINGFHNFSSATITYKSNDLLDSALLYSSSPGLLTIHKLKEYNKRFTSHTMEWIGFALFVTPCLLIPYMLWHSSASKY
ncbi:Translocon-associated protein subunit beta isoform 2 [Schistosoma japonicum]|uniref:Translocon-associated protein subunit beta n=2 Tax=Schistosoma japonicum TaxID=6182 RepID=Q5DES5_SCHJA|nr:SJCHGC05940 protein [Schistosoma japonicum]KAH8851797.1 Translocon-associated protein subunit beta [Schistosoma japonicum]TNN11843.1 Translocon-associated protein subunit beta isoform 2 [Schistosoma japonicum]CAX71107.1 Translocon-associated protein subunit beta precursor [Schistosoma japonicum]CAX76428.1 Translocon-associated protein subunit beta precursor [Schistosoma japonicum]